MLHYRETVRDMLDDDIFSSVDASHKLPKYKIPEKESDPRVAYRIIADELMLDGNSRQNLATFCQTWLEDEVIELMKLSIDKNLVDKDEYPQTAEIERRSVHILADLWNAPDAGNVMGTSTTGSSEAAMLGGMALLWKWRERQKAKNKPTDKPNIVTGPVQVCWHKFARYWDIELREIPMEGDRYIMNAGEVIKRCDENTIAVVPTLGITFTGQFEPVKEVNDALDQFKEDMGLDIPIHVDAASGGFVAPFLYPGLEWDFRLPRVKSINASGHKFGLAPLGVGWLLWHNKEDLPEDLIFWVNYLGGNMPDFALNFSRPGGQVISQYYNYLRLGREGYRKVHSLCRDIAMYTAREIGKLGPFEIIYDGSDGIPAVSWKIKDGVNPGFNLFDLADRLRTRGWLVPAYSLPANRQDLVVQRILVRHGSSWDLSNLLMNDYRDAIAYFKKYPVSRPLSNEEAGSFSH